MPLSILFKYCVFFSVVKFMLMVISNCAFRIEESWALVVIIPDGYKIRTFYIHETKFTFTEFKACFYCNTTWLWQKISRVYRMDPIGNQRWVHMCTQFKLISLELNENYLAKVNAFKNDEERKKCIVCNAISDFRHYLCPHCMSSDNYHRHGILVAHTLY